MASLLGLTHGLFWASRGPIGGTCFLKEGMNMGSTLHRQFSSSSSGPSWL